jgi:FHA domain
MPTCPSGHDSTDGEFCDVCGLAMANKPGVVTPPPAEAIGPNAIRRCAACDAPLDGRFCEACGHDSLAAVPGPTQPPVPEPLPRPAESQDQGGQAAVSDIRAEGPVRPTWTATVSADRAYYTSVMAIGGPDADSVGFPPFCPDRYFPLQARQVVVGRRSASRGIVPDIDLTGPPEDPGVSHLHAMFVVQHDGSLFVVDLESSNGTTMNGGQAPLRPHVAHPLADGDRIHLGAWTTITVRVDGPGTE